MFSVPEIGMAPRCMFMIISPASRMSVPFWKRVDSAWLPKRKMLAVHSRSRSLKMIQRGMPSFVT